VLVTSKDTKDAKEANLVKSERNPV